MVKTILIAAVLVPFSWPAMAANITFASVRDGPCKVEVNRYCVHVKPGGGRIQACLREHQAELSRLCVKGLSAYRNSLNMHLKMRRHARRDPLFSPAARHPLPPPK